MREDISDEAMENLLSAHTTLLGPCHHARKRLAIMVLVGLMLLVTDRPIPSMIRKTTVSIPSKLTTSFACRLGAHKPAVAVRLTGKEANKITFANRIVASPKERSDSF
ncbi:MAG: hypothetical protein AAFX90_18615 [Pseudomonadota bacterium]